MVKKDQWFSASVDDIQNFSLVTCTVSPGFDFRDFKFAAHNQLMEEYPQHVDIIRKFLPDDVRYHALRKNNFMSEYKDQNVT